MLFNGFYAEITPEYNLERENERGEIEKCDGYRIEIYSDSTKDFQLDSFTAAEGHEIMNNTLEDAREFVRDVINSEKSEYMKMMKEDL